jgi:hypothetical protein
MEKRIKVSKKDERMARALAYFRLTSIGFPEDATHERVDVSWMTELEKAKILNKWASTLPDDDLVGSTTQSEIDAWSSGDED